MSGARPDAVIFDLDGTLIDSLPGIEAAARSALHDVVPGRGLPGLRAVIGPPIERMLALSLPDLDDATLAAVVTRFRVHYDTEGWRQTALYPDALSALRRLRAAGVKLLVASNKPCGVSGRILDALGVSPLLARWACRDSRSPAHASKSEVVAWLIDAEGLSPARTLVVGDSPDDDQASRDNGAAFILATYGYGAARFTGPDAAVPRLRRLADLAGLWR